MRNLDDVSDDLWQVAATRELYIRPLALRRRLSVEDIDSAAAALSVSRSYVYRLLSAYRKRPQRSTLLPGRRGPRSPMRSLGKAVDELIDEAIRKLYLSGERPRVSDVVLEIRSQCHDKAFKAPDKRTVRRRILAMDAKKVTTARLGGKRAGEQFNPTLVQSRPEYPLDFVEIDHSRVDVIAVDEENRLPIGRPWLTLAVDIPTRMVLGFYLSFDAPSALSLALVLTHSILGKGSWLAERNLSLTWPASGIPDWIETDNGEEFHSKAFERGTAEYGIRLTYRPPGSPQVGGHIERLIGTFMHRIHLIPGTTFSNVGQKGNYDSEASAVMTLREIERWLALEILGHYHKDQHSAWY